MAAPRTSSRSLTPVPGFCPVVRGTRLARGVPPAQENDNVDWVRRRAYGYPGRRWLAGRELLFRELERAGVRVTNWNLGCGSFGCVYPIEGRPDVVVKITGDFSEAAAARTVVLAEAQGKHFPALVRYHCVYGVKGAPMFAVLMERLLRLDPPEYKFIASVENDLDAANRGDREALASTIARAREALGAHGAEQVRRLVQTVEALRGIGIRYHDLHRGNVLKDASGAWRIIDLGVSVVPTQAVPRLGEVFAGFW